jgi:transcriptional regulator with XRE-family HTH domain
MSTKRKSDAIRFLEKLTGGPIGLGRFLEAVRLGEGMTQPDFAKKLAISKSHLNDIEKGRKAVSPDRAARFAKILGYSQARLVKLALQDLVNRGGLKLDVDVSARN